MNNVTSNTSSSAETTDNQRDIVAVKAAPGVYTAVAPSDNSRDRDNSPHPESKQSSPVIRDGSIDIQDEEEDIANHDDSHNNIPTAYFLPSFLPRGKLTKPTVVQPPKPDGK